MNLLGELIVTVDLEGPEGLASFQDSKVVVVNNLQSDMLFGADMLTRNKYKSWKVDLQQRQIAVEDTSGGVKLVGFNQESDEEMTQKPFPVFLLKMTQIPPYLHY